MASLLKNLLGNSSSDRELGEETRALLHELRQERARFEQLIDAATNASERLSELGEPLARAGADVESVGGRLADVEQKLEAMQRLAELYQSLDQRAGELAERQNRAEAQVIAVVESAQEVTSSMGDLHDKLDRGLALKDQLADFLDIERPFAQLKAEADAVRGQVEGTSEHIVRLREQHDRLLDGQKLATAKLEALDRRRDDLGRSLQDKEGRISRVEQAVKTVDDVQASVDELRRDLGTLKATADLVGQKASTLEAQRETIDRALVQAENLDRVLRQLDAGVQQQKENEKSLALLAEQVAAVHALHEDVVERSRSITQLQHDVDDRAQAARQELAAVSDETKKTVERFDFERRGMEAVTQRVADLRGSLADCEKRFSGLKDSVQLVGELSAKTDAVGEQVEALAAESARIGGEVVRLDAIRRDLDETSRTAREVVEHVARIEQAKPAIEQALADLGSLARAHAAVKDALEQAELVRGELVRAHAGHAETRTWLADVERTIAELRGQASELTAMAPTIEFVQKQTERIGDAMETIEAQRASVEDLARRMTDTAALGDQVEARGRELEERAGAAEERFARLAERADEADQMALTVASVASSLAEANQETAAVRKAVAAIAARAESVEGLAERTRALKAELEQRQTALEEATRMFEQASELRQEAAAAAQQIEERSRRLGQELTAAGEQAKQVGELATGLEERAGGLEAVEQRIDQFEERIARWKQVDQDVARSLEQIIARQDTVETLRGTLERMFELSEKTTNHVREITAAHGEIEESRELVADILGRMREMNDTASSLDERKRQMGKAEERLARAESLLADVQGNLDALQGHKAIVDQAVEKAGSLQFLVKQAEAAIEGLREERKAMALSRFAGSTLRAVPAAEFADDGNGGESDGEEEDEARAA